MNNTLVLTGMMGSGKKLHRKRAIQYPKLKIL